MSDLTLNSYIASGPTADRTAFTPDPPTPASGPDHGYLWYDTDDGKLYAWDGAAWQASAAGGSGGIGNVVGPSSAVDNEIPRYDTTTGKLLQGSGITIADSASGTLAGSNSGDVTLAGTPNYITIAAQVITRALINLASHVTDRLPFANLTAATTDSILLGRRSGSSGDFEEIALGSGLAMSGTTLSATGGSGGIGDVVGPGSSTAHHLAGFADTTGKLLEDSAKAAPSGAIVGTTDSQTLTNKTLTTPTIGDFTNANHDHTNSAGGGQLAAAALLGSLPVLTADPGSPVNGTMWGFDDGGTPANVSIRYRKGGVTYDFPIGTIG
jgi:hypothetical protein